MTFEMIGQAKMHIAAPPQDIYRLVTDVTRIGEWSPECEGASWSEGFSEAVVGAQFAGRNRNDNNAWETPNTVVVADPGREFSWVVGSAEFVVCRWRYTLEAANGGTDVTESFELGNEEVGFRQAVTGMPDVERSATIERRRDQLIADMEHTLRKLKECAERDRL